MSTHKPTDRICPATILTRTDLRDEGKWRRCELTAEHYGDHETTYRGQLWRWRDAVPAARQEQKSK